MGHFKMALIEQSGLLDISKQVNISGKIPKMHFVAPHIIRTHDHLYFGVLKVHGVYVDLESVQTINEYDDVFHMIVKGLDNRFGLYGHVIRRKVKSDFEVAGHSAFTREFNNTYRDKYRNSELYQNELYLTIIYREQAGALSKIKNKATTKSKESREEEASSAIGELTGKLHEISDQLGSQGSGFGASMLDDPEGDGQGEFSELLSFMGCFVHALEANQYAYPSEPLFGFDSPKKHKEFQKYPYGNLGEFLATHEMRFAPKRYFTCNRSDGTSFIGAMLTIKQYGVGTTPISFDRLLRLDSELCVTLSYFPFTRDKALHKAKRVREKHSTTGDKALSQLDHIGELEDEIASENVTMGQFHNSVMVLSEFEKGRKVLDKKCHEVIKTYSEAGFRANVETFNTNAAFWAQFPCNRNYILRGRPAQSDVAAHFFAMHNYPTGHSFCTHLGEGLCLVDSPSQTPMWFNWHSKGSGAKSEIEPGHSMIYGANKFGKTVLMLAMNALAEKYNTRSFLFDYEHGMYAYAVFTNSPYLSYDVEFAKTIKHNPFLMPDSDETRLFCVNFLCDIVRNKSEKNLNDETLEIEIDEKVKECLVDCVNHAFDRIPSAQRTLSNVCDLYLDFNFPRWIELKHFLRANPDKNRGQGLYAEFFDNDEDVFNTGHQKLFFETSKLAKQPKLKTVLLKYIFYKIKASRLEHNDPIAIHIDEMWYNLDDPSWAGWLKAELATLRKKDIHIIGATQSVDSMVGSPIAAQFMTNSATAIFAPNASAHWDVYKKFNITQAEFEFLKRTPVNKRLFLYQQSHESAICKLNLAGFDRHLSVFSTNQASKKVLDALLIAHDGQAEELRELFYEKLGETL